MSILPAPNELGAPDQYTTWRDFQDQAVDDGIQSEARFVVQSMPTGSGKSLVCVTQALAQGFRVAYLTSTKGLQDQLIKDFGGIVADLRGKDNYACLADEHPASCTGWHHTKDPECLFASALRAAKASQLVVTNYSMWLNSMAYSGERNLLGNFDMLILDEGHNAPDELAGFLGFEITRKHCTKLLELREMPTLPSVTSWQEWGSNMLIRLKSMIEQETSELVHELSAILGIDPESHGLQELLAAVRKRGATPKGMSTRIKHLKQMDALQFTLIKLSHLDPQLWVHERVKDHTTKFDIINPATEAEKYLFSFALYHEDPQFGKRRIRRPIPKVLLVSATVRPKTCEMLGIPEDQRDFLEYPHTFPVHNRLTLYVPTVKMSFRSSPQDIRFWVNRMDQIIRTRKDRKGIIHTVSYKRRDTILELSKNSDMMISHGSKEADHPCILVSPSVSTGFDFPYSECEYQIIGKVPWPSTQSEIMKARKLMDPDYMNYLAMQELIQAAGRGSRAPDDQCEVFVIDEQFSWFPWKFKEFAPEWFLESIKKTTSLPKPPKALLGAI
jgi:Rad3-related DNA helicase